MNINSFTPLDTFLNTTSTNGELMRERTGFTLGRIEHGIFNLFDGNINICVTPKDISTWEYWEDMPLEDIIVGQDDFFIVAKYEDKAPLIVGCGKGIEWLVEHLEG